MYYHYDWQAEFKRNEFIHTEVSKKYSISELEMMAESQNFEVKKHFFDQKIVECERAGIVKERLWLDPGFGFGKTLDDNYKLLGDLDQFVTYKMPILAGLSRKSMIGNLLNVETNDRMLGSVIAATLALSNGANILRVHDVAETHQAVTIYNAMNQGLLNE